MNPDIFASGWIKLIASHPGARLRMFCFPYAGGGAAVYRSWGEAIPATLELCAIQLPGRENRIAEDPIDTLSVLVPLLTREIIPGLADMPCAFYGHSMGAFLAFEVARALRRQPVGGPAMLFVGGQRAPHLPDPDPPVHALPDAEFVDKLRQLNGTPEEILQNADILDLALPMLRADFAVCETYRYREEVPLACPIVAFGGSEDTEISTEELSQWEKQTSASFQMHILPGDHFFLQSAQETLLRLIIDSLTPIMIR